QRGNPGNLKRTTDGGQLTADTRPPIFYLHRARAAAHNRITLMSEMNLFDLTGEVAVVIGATGVLGGAIAEGLARAGARVGVAGRNAERGEARVKQIQQAGGTAAFFPADAMARESLRAANQQIEKSLGTATVLVNA